MSANLADFEKALKQAALAFVERDVADGGLELDPATAIAWPSVDFTPPSNGAYVIVHTLGGGGKPKTVGLGGFNEVSGIMQLDLCYPAQEGDGALLAAWQALDKFFQTPGTSTFDDSKVYWLRCSRSPLIKDQNRIIFACSVYYRAEYPRPAPTHISN